jgi:threonine dehydrogenase-like Zn-dependent dehydrogenase
MSRFLLVAGPDDAHICETPARPLAEGQARVAVAFCGLCRSDTHAIRGFSSPAPARFGHEVAGTVIEAGPDAPFPVGAAVVAMVGDGYATEIDVGCDHLVPVPDGVSLADAALAEPISCILSGLDQVDLRNTERVHIVGSGFMGALAVALLARRGYEVTVIEPRAAARELAVRMGASEILYPHEATPLKDAAELVLECTGAAGGLELAGELAAIDGQLSIVGYHQSDGGRRTVDMKAWNYKCLRVVNAHTRSEQRIRVLLRRALRMMARGSLIPSEFVTASVDLADLPEWIAAGEEFGETTIKTLVSCAPHRPVGAEAATA